jgi:hypothetical protein
MQEVVVTTLILESRTTPRTGRVRRVDPFTGSHQCTNEDTDRRWLKELDLAYVWKKRAYDQTPSVGSTRVLPYQPVAPLIEMDPPHLSIAASLVRSPRVQHTHIVVH